MESEEEQKKDIIDFVQSGAYPRMYRLVYEDGTLSQDFHNKTRTRDLMQISQIAQKKRKDRGKD